MFNSPALSDEQVQQIVDILLLYAPDNWLLLTMVYKTDETMTNIKTWAKTTQNNEHGFVLDDSDANTIEGIFEGLWIDNQKKWNSSVFSIDNNGNYNISFQ